MNMSHISAARQPLQGKYLPRESNPFATRFIHPGAQPFLFADGSNAHKVVDRLEENDWWGQIVGPHGSGKSTLISTLEPALEQHGRDVIHLRMHENERQLPAKLFSSNVWRPATQLVVDGYEQLSRVNRWRIKRHCRRQNCGLLVTTHVDVGLPTIYTTEPTVQIAEQLVAQLLELHGNSELVGEGPYASERIRPLLDKHRGNLRELLFELYDLYESERSL
jgi:hypothetical protein